MFPGFHTIKIMDFPASYVSLLEGNFHFKIPNFSLKSSVFPSQNRRFLGQIPNHRAPQEGLLRAIGPQLGKFDKYDDRRGFNPAASS